MEQRKRGRKRLGNRKRRHNVMLRFNNTEYDRLKVVAGYYNLDISERGVISPLLRRMVLNGESEEKEKLPDTTDLAHHINRIGNNINQLVKLVHHKSLRSPNSKLDYEMIKIKELLNSLIEITIGEPTG